MIRRDRYIRSKWGKEREIRSKRGKVKQRDTVIERELRSKKEREREMLRKLCYSVRDPSTVTQKDHPKL